MKTAAPLHYRPLADLARGLRAREFSPVELADHLLSRIDRLDVGLNAFRLVCRERVLEEARAAEIRLHDGRDGSSLNGIPYDRQEEEETVDVFAHAIIRAGDDYLDDPMESPFIPSWSRVDSDLPDLAENLAKAVEADNA